MHECLQGILHIQWINKEKNRLKTIYLKKHTIIQCTGHTYTLLPHIYGCWFAFIDFGICISFMHSPIWNQYYNENVPISLLNFLLNIIYVYTIGVLDSYYVVLPSHLNKAYIRKPKLRNFLHPTLVIEHMYLTKL